MLSRHIITTLLIGQFALLGGRCLPLGQGVSKIPDDQVVSWVDRRVEEWQPKPSERRFDEIAWVPNLKSAYALALKHQRPVFMFTMDGRINLGRC